jgi:hypothetical protein
MNSQRIVQHRTHIHTLNPFTREETIEADFELADANERNPKVRSVTLWGFKWRHECTYLFPRRINDYASKLF